MIGVTASSLTAKSCHPAVKRAVLEESRRIDDQLIRAHSAGLTYLRYQLTTDYQIGSLNKQDGQLVVYTELLKLYNLSEQEGGKGFTATITLAEPSYMHIKWPGGMSEMEKKQRKDYLTRYLQPL